MNINNKVDPEIEEFLSDVKEASYTRHLMSATEMREWDQARSAKPIEHIPVHEVTELLVPASHGNIACRLYKPVKQNKLPVLIWFHGGGWVLGDLDKADHTCRHLAVESGCAIISVDYRLAPEHPFPAAFDDSLAAVHWVFDNAEQIGVDKDRIAVGGDSAGGNLAACACIAARELQRSVKFQLLIYPVVEPDFDNASYTENANDYYLTKNLMKWFWDQYVPDTAMRNDARVMPLAGKLEGLPPAWVLTAHFDPLRDEGIKYATALQNAGVSVTSDQTGDAVHGFFTMPVTAGAKVRQAAAFQLKSALS